MSQTAISLEDASLLVALEQNEFDIAGLAEFSVEDQAVDRCLRQLYSIIDRRREPSRRDKNLLAQVLYGMVAVARNDYAAHGHQEYWPFLFDHIRDAATGGPDKFCSETLAGPQSQALLGRWFRIALDTFGYSIPEGGQKYVSPIVFHAGMPHASLPRVLKVIATACDQYGPQAVTLPADIRSELVTNHSLHRNVERLLTSNLQGAAQLWGCLARVVLAWKTLGDCSAELQQLPLALDPDEVRAALPPEVASTRATRAALPQLRYDPDTGEIRLSFPGTTTADWKITSNGVPIDLAWARTHVGRTAEFRGPLPEQISVEPINTAIGISRTFYPQPLEWPGFWFHAHNGNLEDGRTIDASGLASGRWYVVFEGTPTKCSVPFSAQIQLKWSWFAGYGDWTAWEVDVPPRTTERDHLEWYVDDNCFRVPLARRPGPRVEFHAEAATKAFTPDGNQLQVFDSAPQVTLKREVALSVQLLKETNDSVVVIERLELEPEKPTRLPVSRPGVYQLRESRGVGRTLLHFAVVPGFQIQGPKNDTNRSLVSVTISADVNAGHVCSDEDRDVSTDGRAWIVQSSIVEPFVDARWCWSADDIPSLEFRWPVEALRWRVTQANGVTFGWSREPFFISPKTVAKHDAQLEIQLPVGSDLSVNGELYEGRRQSGPSGSTLVLSLLSYGDMVELFHEGRRYAAVFQSERPLLDSIDAIADADSLIVSWRASTLQAGTAVVAWDPFDISSPPTTFALAEEELASGEWGQSWTELPGSQWTAISLARAAGGFFQPVLHMAASRSAKMWPISLLVNRSTGAVMKYSHGAATWVEFVHYASSLRLHGTDVSVDDLGERLAALDKNGELNIDDTFLLVSRLQKLLEEKTINGRDRRWSDTLLRSLLAVLNRIARENPTRILSGNGPSTCRLDALLNFGIPVRQAYPFRWMANREPIPGNSVYPFAYIRDLWLLGTDRTLLQQQLSSVGILTPENYDELQVNAARDVLQFHKHFGLPPLSAFLPLGRRTATVERSDCGHRHCFGLPPLPETFNSAIDLCEALGLQDKALDCQATCDDQFFADRDRVAPSRNAHVRSVGHSPTRTGEYSLYWCSDENRWAIEKPSASSRTCCYTNCQPLIVDPWRPSELANCLLRDVLNQWSNAEHAPKGIDNDFAFLNSLRDRLIGDEVSGSLHAELFAPAETERKELFGRIVEVETKPGLPNVATIAWQLAWIERVSAWEGTSHVFESDSENPSAQKEFLRGLAKAISLWPELIRRCIALAELVYWTLYRGGLGTAVRYRGPYMDEQFATLRATSTPIHRVTIGQPAAVEKPPADHVANVSGVILGYNAGIGVVLLRHRSSPSLGAAVKKYVKSGDGEQGWFASFQWRSLREQDREMLQKLLSQRRRSRVGLRSLTLADEMCGLPVTCELTKNPTWKATKVDISFGSDRFNIPKHRRKP